MWSLVGVGIFVLCVGLARSPTGKRLRNRLLTRKMSNEEQPPQEDPFVRYVDGGGENNPANGGGEEEKPGKFHILNDPAYVRATDLRTQQTYYMKKSDLDELYRTRKHTDFLIEEDL